MENPQIAANMHLISLPEYLMDMLKSEDANDKLNNDEARAVLRLGRHLENEYCTYLYLNGRIDSCEAAEELPDAMDVVISETSTDHDYYKTMTINEETGSGSYYGHSECFK